jgi:hypothetical protein
MFGKTVFDPGHGTRINAGPNGYFEGDTMLQLGLMLKAKGYQLTKEDSSDPVLLARVKQAKALGANTLISLHTNWVPPDNPTSTEETMVIYSLNKPQDKAIAEYIAAEIASAIGVKKSKVWTRHASYSTPQVPVDYYGILRHSVSLGIEHAFIIEHCNHAQMSVDTDVKLKKIVECYERILKGDSQMNPIMGKAQATVAQMDSFMRKVNTQAPDVAQIYLEEGEIEGVKGDIAFAQALKETSYFRFTGLAKPEWHNPAGLGVTGQKVNGEPVGNKFPDWRTGIRAQIQHLKAYASKEPLKQTCVDERYALVSKGIAPNWEQLNGRWAVPGPTYGQDIIKIWQEILKMPADDELSKLRKENTELKETITKLESRISVMKAHAKTITEA